MRLMSVPWQNDAVPSSLPLLALLALLDSSDDDAVPASPELVSVCTRSVMGYVRMLYMRSTVSECSAVLMTAGVVHM